MTARTPGPLARLEPWQRTTLMVLGLAVLIAAVILIVVAANRPPGEGSAAPAPTSSSTSETTASTIPVTTTATTTGDSTTTAPTTTTTTVSTTTTAAATTTTSAASRLVLRPSGLGTVFFGTPADDAVRRISELLGENPDDDTGWTDPAAPGFNSCIGTQLRFVRWGSLKIFLTDADTGWAPKGTPHFAEWLQSDQLGRPVWKLATAEGVGLDTPVGDVRGIYGAGSVSDDPLLGPSFVVDPPGAAVLRGFLTGTDAQDRVVALEGGFACDE